LNTSTHTYSRGGSASNFFSFSSKGKREETSAPQFYYEKDNHLGNVLVVVSDRKLPVDINADNIVDYYTADVVSATDYYAFGSPMPGRQFSSNSYRYGFNGKEKDDEVKGNGNSYDFGARIYDPRIGRWLSCDPWKDKYPSVSPYNYVENNPLIFKDPTGKGPTFAVQLNYGTGADSKKVISGHIVITSTIYLYPGSANETNRAVTDVAVAASGGSWNWTGASPLLLDLKGPGGLSTGLTVPFTVTVKVDIVYLPTQAEAQAAHTASQNPSDLFFEVTASPTSSYGPDYTPDGATLNTGQISVGALTPGTTSATPGENILKAVFSTALSKSDFANATRGGTTPGSAPPSGVFGGNFPTAQDVELFSKFSSTNSVDNRPGSGTGIPVGKTNNKNNPIKTGTDTDKLNAPHTPPL